jgi:hypothetical protein
LSITLNSMGAFPVLPREPVGHAGRQVAPEEVEASSPTSEVDHSGLVRMEREPEPTEEGERPPPAFSAWL